MKNRKGQTNIIGFLLITLIVLVIVSSTFFWAKGFLDDSNHVNEISRVENRLIELDKAIRDVANEQSQRTVKFEVDEGYLFIDNNHTITFSFARNPPKAFDNTVAILGNTSRTGPCFNYSVIGTLGTDRSSCIIRNGRELSVNYIMLNDTNTNNCYSVQFDAGDNAAAGKGMHDILITYAQTNTTTECNNSYIQVVKIDIS
ncbi:hypothetical protein HOD83_02010 [Candidatus Woesearchaeota archaeon]|jgi:hypothetical protein|nr:hypothetical protein [Candidatus Woesearchaeota archaeon]MBT4114181.1 hypothetical protein [Candidatus Woesearchaeota archaeon]MBT4248340.1 hypothetical protein [Candidatus Woesearchaeota archaeon]